MDKKGRHTKFIIEKTGFRGFVPLWLQCVYENENLE
jgi:hypothetical protein